VLGGDQRAHREIDAHGAHGVVAQRGEQVFG